MTQDVHTAAACEALDALREATVAFGHQSVGQNIVQGIAELTAACGGGGPSFSHKWPSGRGDGFGLYDVEIGVNGDAPGKIRDFTARSFAGVDVALMKLCYVDFDATTDAEAVYREYSKALRGVEADNPSTIFLHVTVPLTTQDSGLKALAKRILGRPLRGYQDNLQRQRYNELLREEFGGSGRVFDIALLEAEDPQGHVHKRNLDGEAYYVLYPGYTTDGGHLNELGRRRVAQALVVAIYSALADGGAKLTPVE